MGKLDLVYERLPVFAQHLVVSGFGLYWHWLRFGPGYKKQLAGYLDRERFSSEQWRTWQNLRLKIVLQNAAGSVPYYKNQWDNQQKKAAAAGRLSELPLLEKGPLRENSRLFLRGDMSPSNEYVFQTSGSTGTPIATIWTAQEIRDSLAVREARSAGWADVSFKLPRATFSGRMVEPDPESAGPFYRFNIVERQVYFSPFHIRPDTAHFYVEALRRHNIQWLTGYAVSYYILAKFILERGLPVPRLRAIITTSEKVTPEMKEVMEEAFGCQVFEEYSTVENAVFVSECEYGSLHVSPDVSVLEILRPDGTPCDLEEKGEVVATSLTRLYQPFIRYRLGDVAMWSADPCPCEREMPIIKEVVGRMEDVVVGPDGRQMVRFHGVFIGQPHVREGQIIQKSLTEIEVRVVPSNGFNETDILDIIHRVQQRLGTPVSVNVVPVTRIERTAAGKFQAVISHIN